VYGTFVWRAAVEIEHVPKKPWRVVGGPDGAPRRERLPPVVVGQVPPSRWLDDENALHGPWPDYRKIVEVERSLTDPWAGWAWAPGQGNVQVPMDGVQGPSPVVSASWFTDPHLRAASITFNYT
jgi:hypothetical protein